MARIPQKIVTRIKKNVPKFQKVLNIAKTRDVNESDTVSIITDMLHDIFGYEKYLEITSELAIRGTFCDLAIKIDDKYSYLIECKAIGIDLKENHKKQAIDYGANKGISWIILTNGMIWEIYRLRFEQPINYDLVFTLDFKNINIKEEKDIELLYLLCQEASSKKLIETYFEKVQRVNKYILGNMLLCESVISAVKREMRKFADGIRIESDEISEIIEHEVLKREIVEGDEAEDAQKRLKKHLKKSTKPKRNVVEKQVEKNEESKVEALSVTERLLQESANSEE